MEQPHAKGVGLGFWAQEKGSRKSGSLLSKGTNLPGELHCQTQVTCDLPLVRLTVLRVQWHGDPQGRPPGDRRLRIVTGLNLLVKRSATETWDEGLEQEQSTRDVIRVDSLPVGDDGVLVEKVEYVCGKAQLLSFVVLVDLEGV